MPSTTPFDHTLFDLTLRYERTPGAKYHVRPLSLLQQELLYRCNGRVTVADLADATLAPHAEIREALNFLSIHGLVKTHMPETWLFKPPIQRQTRHQPTQPRPLRGQPAQGWRFLGRLKQSLQSRRAAF